MAIHTQTAESVRKQRFLYHYIVKCPNCGEELIISTPNLRKEADLYKPKKRAYKYWQGGIGPEYERIGEELVSSDPSKDTVKVHCCNCGHTWDELVNDVRKNICNWKGDNTITFELSEKESEKARVFEEKHIKKCCPNQPFTALGMQFTYTFTSGGFGPLVTVKCNACGETENITCTEDW